MNPPHTSTPASDNTDHLLKAMASVQPSPGMEQRILSAIKRHATEPQAHPQRLGRLRFSHFKPALALTFTFALSAVLLALLFRPRSTISPELPFIADYAADLKMPPSAVNGETTQQIDIMPKLILNLNPPPLRAANPQPAKRATPPLPPQPLDHTLAPPAINASGSSPALASFPAPPLPLTDQEKLLLRLAHRNDPETLDALTSAKRAAEQAQEKSDFDSFFPAPHPIEDPALLISQANQPSPLPSVPLISGAKK